ncbi:hypothetical protein LJY25_04690 [Hymenobacter sp. BT175]|uniref:hypothetical protein n=1 Tax=Hymenobacter translucens TaxID=2886507 RepID=UPI001D0ED015|nr:hypothetical protein [Hymenobacter translucens]MCC2545733.1 hypothetical protein [Hymenobacter translucens]
MRCLLLLPCALLLARPLAGRQISGPESGLGVETRQLRPVALRGVLPDTTKPRPVVRPDSVQAQPAAGLTPDEDEKPTRKSAIRIVGAIALLTLTTLLLYNVRSR